jgi:hypothetical protein
MEVVGVRMRARGMGDLRGNMIRKWCLSAYFLLFPILCLFVIGKAYATPEASDWYKADLIGANKTSMFYYLTHEELPGSYYYSFTHYYLVSRNIETGKIEKKSHLKSVKNMMEMKFKDDEVDEVIYKQENRFSSDIIPLNIISDNNVEALYPNVDVKKAYRFDKNGMYHMKNKKRVDVLPVKYLKKYLDEYEDWVDWEDGINIVQIYSNRDYFFYILKYGTGGDMNFYQAILPIKREVIYENR